MEKNNKTVKILRWLAFFPAAIVGGFLAYNMVWLLQEISLRYFFIDTGKIFGQIFTRFFSYLAMGIVAIKVSCFIVPSFKKEVATVMSGLVLIFSGATIFYALSVPEYLGILDSIAMDIGAIITALSIYSEQSKST